MRLPAQPGELLDRSETLRFRLGEYEVEGFRGDTIGSALFASGRRVFSRSFKYHRPRGLLCCSGHCPNCMMTVDGVPNVRVCVEPLREGAVVTPQNVVGRLDFDLMSVVDKLGGPFTPVGFYYRTMIRPRFMWPLYEKFLRGVAGLGRLDEHAGHSRRYDVEHRRARVLVIGGGQAGRAAALAAATTGPGVVLVDEGTRLRDAELAGVEVIAPARALGIWEGKLVPVDAGTVLYRYRAERVIVATGAVEQPLVFPGNDLAGVMLPEAVRRLVRDFSIRPGRRAVVLASDDEALEIADTLREAGVAVPRVVDLREGTRKLEAHGRGGKVRRIVVDGDATDCDLVVVSGGRQPAYSLLSQAGARVEYDESLRVFVPTDIPDGIEAVGSVTGEGLERGCRRAGVRGPRQVLRLRVRGRHDEGRQARDRRGVRLDRALEALHDGDDGPLPGQALPAAEHPSLREVSCAATSRRSGRRPRGRPGRRSRWACSRGVISSRRGARRSTSGTRSSARR